MLGSNHVVKNSSYVPVLHDFTYRLISIDKASRTFETRGGTLPSSDADRSLDQCYHLIPFFFGLDPKSNLWLAHLGTWQNMKNKESKLFDDS